MQALGGSAADNEDYFHPSRAPFVTPYLRHNRRLKIAAAPIFVDSRFTPGLALQLGMSTRDGEAENGACYTDLGHDAS